VCTADELRGLDEAAEGLGIPTIVLMENAAIHAASVARELSAEGDPVLIACGKGHNGGDGLAAARHLVAAGREVGIVFAGKLHDAEGDTATHAHVARSLGCPIAEVSALTEHVEVGEMIEGWPAPRLVIDAVFGTGLSREPAGPPAILIDVINELRSGGAGVLALDVPSGMVTDTGEVTARHVSADVTVTFAAMKAGFFNPAAHGHTGRVVVAPIGVPGRLLADLGEPCE